MKRLILVILCTTLWPQLSITAVDGVTEYVIDFDNTVSGVNNGQYDGTFPYSNPQTGDLDADAWIFKRTVTLIPDSTYFGGVSTGGETSGKFYSYDISNGGTLNRALGFQPTTDFLTPGSITFEIINNTGSTATHITISYNIWEYNTASHSTYVYFSHSSDNVTYTQESSMDFISVEAPGASTWVSSNKAIWLQGLSIPNGSSYYFKWDSNDYSGSGGRDEIALDDITISMGTALSINNIILPDNFGLLKAYPNPFNPTTMIRYQLNEMGDTQVKLFNLSGGLMEELIHSIQTAGEHSIRLDGSQFSSGIYIIELKTRNYRDTQFITLIK